MKSFTVCEVLMKLANTCYVFSNLLIAKIINEAFMFMVDRVFNMQKTRTFAVLCLFIYSSKI